VESASLPIFDLLEGRALRARRIMTCSLSVAILRPSICNTQTISRQHNFVAVVLDKRPPFLVKRACGPNIGRVTGRFALRGGTNLMNQSLLFIRLANRHCVSAQCCSHGAVSPCWKEHRRRDASTQRGGYSSCPMRSWLGCRGAMLCCCNRCFLSKRAGKCDVASQSRFA
jgi:hypothetical protein